MYLEQRAAGSDYLGFEGLCTGVILHKSAAVFDRLESAFSVILRAFLQCIVQLSPLTATDLATAGTFT